MLAGTPAKAAVVYGVQATTGRILTIDPATGVVLNSFATPTSISATQTFAGLSYAAPLNQLLYLNSAVSTTLYRLNPVTGMVSATASGDSFPNSGLSYELISGVDYLYYDHTNADLHRQTGIGGNTAFFFTSGIPTTGVGGDGYGREFAQYSDGMIHEFNITTGVFLSSFAAPTGVLGLAFDGSFLYASTSLGTILTLNANTGALIRTVNVAGGNLVEIGANAVPEPSSLAIIAILGTAFVGYRFRRNTKAV